MITLYQLAEQCAQILNANANNLDGFIENTSFDFVIHINEGEYLKASRNLEPTTAAEANHVTYHINALMRSLSSNYEGDYKTFSDGSLNGENISTMISAEMSTSIEFLVPFPSVAKAVTLENNEIISYTLGETVYSMVVDTLQQGWSATLNDSTDQSFLVGSRFTVPSANLKEIRAIAGESLSFTVYGEHFFVAEGVNSNRIRIYYDGDRIPCTRIGIARRTEMDSNLFSETVLPRSKNIPLGTSLTVSMDLIYTLGTFGNALTDFLADGTQPSGVFKIAIPKIAAGGSYVIEKEYSMIFSSVGLNAQIGTVASVSVQVVEKYNG